MIRTPHSIASEIRFLLGCPDEIDDAPDIPFHPLRIDFLSDLSKLILADARAKQFPDVVTFAFWCRRANIEGFAKRQDRSLVRLGLGLVFHLAPANVPINFAYSLVFSFLAGNSSVIRMSSAENARCDLLIGALAELLGNETYRSLRNVIHLVRYAKADHITEFWLQNSLGRVIWGGDATVAYVRSLESHPRSREIAFVDRYSASVIDARAVIQTTDRALQDLCGNLHNDIYLMDQKACSSPQLLIWLGTGDDIEAAKTRLWPRFADFVRTKYRLEAVHAMDKYVELCQDVIDHQNIASVAEPCPVSVTRVQLQSLLADQCQQRGHFGTVHEFSTENLDVLSRIVDARFQTLTYFGLDSETLKAFIRSNRLSGIDRIVPIGRALDMGYFWDGFDVLSSLSRTIVVQ